MTRQQRIGWILVVLSCAYLAYFLKVRLFEPGPYIERREWLQVIGTVACFMMGVINVRLAARTRAQREARLSKQSPRGS